MERGRDSGAARRDLLLGPATAAGCAGSDPTSSSGCSKFRSGSPTGIAAIWTVYRSAPRVRGIGSTATRGAKRCHSPIRSVAAGAGPSALPEASATPIDRPSTAPLSGSRLRARPAERRCHRSTGRAIPALVGRLALGDRSRAFEKASGQIFLASPPTEWGGRWTLAELLELDDRLLGMASDRAGELYLLTDEQLGPFGRTGKVFRLVLG